MPYKPGSFEEVTWEDVRLAVKTIAPDIFEAVEKISPDSNYKLYIARYAYGAPIIDDKSIFNIQFDEKLISIDSEEMPKQIKEQLSYHYHGIPLGLVLDGQLQLSALGKNGATFPEIIFEQGNLVASQAAIDLPYKHQATYYWRMRSGARTVYMLPSIANREKFNRLKNAYNLSNDVPLSQVDHWDLFQAIANSPHFPENWCSKCLFFGKKFVEKLEDHPDFYIAVTKRVQKSTAFIRNNTLDRMWDDLVLSIKNKKVDHYILNMARYIIRASIGDRISFKVLTTTDQAGPFNQIVRAIVEIYGLTKYAPIIMVPQLYQYALNSNAYISIQLPAVDCKRRYTSKNNYLMSDFREIHYVIEKFLVGIKEEVVSEVPLYNFNKYAYNFYTADKDNDGMFKPVESIFINDPSINYWTSIKDDKIDTRNTFMRACVKVS